MELIKKAFIGLFEEDRYEKYVFSLKYSGKFSDFNANVKMQGDKISFSLSKRWKGIDDDIVIGLIQHLLKRLFKSKKLTNEIKLYELFTKNIHMAATKIESDPKLIQIFNKVNDEYFYGNIDMPNLKFGNRSMSTLGSYNFHTDTIRISTILEEEELIEYVMYHELLHKKLKFHSKNGRTYHHTNEFRKKEREFPNFHQIEKKLNNLGRKPIKQIKIKRKITNLFDFFK